MSPGVDYFVILESDRTAIDQAKPLFVEGNWSRFAACKRSSSLSTLGRREGRIGSKRTRYHSVAWTDHRASSGHPGRRQLDSSVYTAHLCPPANATAAEQSCGLPGARQTCQRAGAKLAPMRVPMSSHPTEYQPPASQIVPNVLAPDEGRKLNPHPSSTSTASN